MPDPPAASGGQSARQHIFERYPKAKLSVHAIRMPEPAGDKQAAGDLEVLDDRP
jgi:hypothetical protein